MHLIYLDNQYLLYNEKNLEVFKIKNDLGKKLENLSDNEINELMGDYESNVLHENELDENYCDRLVLVVAEVCNLGCKYCYAQQGTYGENQNMIMSLDTLKQTIEYTLNIFPSGINKIQFFGGEPLMNLSLLEAGCDWITKYFKKKNLTTPLFTIVTNGTLIDNRVIKLFNKYKFSVTVSLDGNKPVNDINRVFKNSCDSVFELVYKNLKDVTKKRKFSLSIEMTIDDANVQQYVENGNKLIDLQELRKLNPDMMHIVPAMWPKGCKSYAPDYMENLCKYIDDFTKISVKSTGKPDGFGLFKTVDMAGCLYFKKKRKYLCGAGLNELSINVCGDIYPCFTLIGAKEYFMGNIYFPDEKKFKEIRDCFRKNTYDNIDKCNGCWAKGVCSNCIGNAYYVNGGIEKPLDILCEVQKVQLKRVLLEMVERKSGEKSDVG